MRALTIDPNVEYRASRLGKDKLAGSYVLREIAERGLLRDALVQVGLVKVTGLVTASAKPAHVVDLLPPNFLVEAQSATGLTPQQVEKHVLQQLHNVAAFANSDGMSVVDENIRAAEYLIKSGQAAMFA